MAAPKKPAGKVRGPAAAVSGQKSKVRAKTGTTTYKAKAKPPAPKKESPLDTLGREIQKRVDLATGKTRTPISDAMRVTRTGPTKWKVKP